MSFQVYGLIVTCLYQAYLVRLHQQCLYASEGDLKGLGHAILGNFNTDQMVIELTKI